jgi:hypothetical protein
VFSEILVSAIGLGFSLFLFILSRKFPPSTQPGVPGAAFFPGIVAVVIFALAMVQVVRIAVKRTRPGGGEKAEDSGQNKKNIIRIIEIVLLMLLYSLLWMFNLGHFLLNSTVIFIPVALLYGGAVEREWWKTSIFVVILVVFIYCLFKFLLKVPI